MPLPMVHLLLVEKIKNKLQRESDNYFILGSIAPDAIHARQGTIRIDKHRTHMFSDGYGSKISIENNLRNVKAVLERTGPGNSVLWEFTKGYCIHTMLDMIWIIRVFNVLAETLRSGSINFNDIRTKYYEETNYCDAQIYCNGMWCREYRRILIDTKPIGFGDLLSEEEVSVWRDEVLLKMERFEGYKGDSYYITYNSISAFVDNFAEEIIDCFNDWGYKL